MQPLQCLYNVCSVSLFWLSFISLFCTLTFLYSIELITLIRYDILLSALSVYILPFSYFHLSTYCQPFLLRQTAKPYNNVLLAVSTTRHSKYMCLPISSNTDNFVCDIERVPSLAHKM